MTVTGQENALGSFGNYALLRKLGEGHLGPVYKALAQGSDKPVALRVLCDDIRWDADLDDRFFRACQAMAGLQHPNVAALLEAGQVGRSRFIATEFLGNNDLGKVITQKSVPTVEEKLSVMVQAAEGLSYAHSKGILHRGLKPGKIHLATDGCVKIRDFSITHLFRRSLAHPGVRWGTPLYMPPEEIQHAECDARSDVFSAGIVFYELLTGLHPFHDRNSNKAVDRILFDSNLPTIDEFPDLPPGLWAILEKCLAKDPDNRYPAISDFSEACRNLLKDMGEDSQMMLAELQAALPRLRKAASLPAASRSTVNLFQDVQRLLGKEGKTDYTSLDRLMAALADQYPTLQATAGEPELAPLSAPVSPEEPLPVTPAAMKTVPVTPERAGEGSPAESTDQAGSASSTALPASAVKEENDSTPQLPVVVPMRRSYTYRSIPRPSFRMAAALLSVLLIVTAAYLFRGTIAAASLQSAWSTFLPGLSSGSDSSAPSAPTRQPRGPAAQTEGKHPSADGDQLALGVLLKEAKALADQKRLYESRVLIQRILEKSPDNEAALGMLQEMDALSRSREALRQPPDELQTALARISKLIRSGKLQPAKAELDQLQQSYPEAPELAAMRKRWEARNSQSDREQARKADEQRAATLQRKEAEWTRRVTDLFAQGDYNGARGALALWLADDASSAQARVLLDRVETVQRYLQACETALAGGTYQEALTALETVERLNPGDPGLAELRRRIDSRRAAARASLTIRRLGDRATLLVDGKPAGSNGEIQNESVSIGAHTIGIESAGAYHAARNVDFAEGQQVAFVYDLAAQLLRPMTDRDVDLVAQREAKEEMHRFNVEHNHGMLRGSCKGALSFNFFGVEFKSDSGWHGFQVPQKDLVLKRDGKSLDLFSATNTKFFHTFRAQNAQEAEKLLRVWVRLDTLRR